jgi:hypothetical protein
MRKIQINGDFPIIESAVGRDRFLAQQHLNNTGRGYFRVVDTQRNGMGIEATVDGEVPSTDKIVHAAAAERQKLIDQMMADDDLYEEPEVPAEKFSKAKDEAAPKPKSKKKAAKKKSGGKAKAK